MSFWKRIFGKTRAINPYQGLNEKEKNSIVAFSKLPPNERIRKVLEITATHNTTDFALFQYALHDDPDHNVQLAALKRVVAFIDHPKLRPLLFSIKESKRSDSYEPYLSMAIARTGK